MGIYLHDTSVDAPHDTTHVFRHSAAGPLVEALPPPGQCPRWSQAPVSILNCGTTRTVSNHLMTEDNYESSEKHD